MTSPFTLHVRLTKNCNADCSYCSSWQESHGSRMSPDEFERSIRWIYSNWQSQSVIVDYLTIEYVGGEILLIPPAELERIVLFARQFFSERGVHVHDGVQTNLIGSPRRLDHLRTLFGSRIGTSVDSYTEQRTIKGDAAAYQTFFRGSEAHVGAHLPGVFTLDRKSAEFALDQLALSESESRPTTFRPAFAGGKDISGLPERDFTGVMVALFRSWSMASQVRIEPFATLLEKRMRETGLSDSRVSDAFCPHQADCTSKSLSLEPNGDLYVCQEMADASLARLGNALTADWDAATWDALAVRPRRLDSECYSCDYFQSCQGGCMMQSIQSGNGYYGRSEYCGTWKALFAEIDELISAEGGANITSWLSVQAGAQ